MFHRNKHIAAEIERVCVEADYWLQMGPRVAKAFQILFNDYDPENSAIPYNTLKELVDLDVELKNSSK